MIASQHSFMKTQFAQPHWHILGAGSLGCLWAARLAKHQQSVSLIVRSAERLEQFPGQVSLQTGAAQSAEFFTVNAELAKFEHSTLIRHLLVASKAYDTVAAISEVAHRLAPNAHIVLLQNGLGSQQAVLKQFATQHIIAASTTDGAYLQTPFQVIWAGKGVTQLGNVANSQTPAPTWLTQWQQAAIDCHWTSDIWRTLWFKLAINCAINPLTVLYQCKNGELEQQPDAVNALLPELSVLLSTAGFSTTTEQLHNLIWSVIEKTANNTSSMLQDVQQKRPTEADFITGFACNYAKQHQLDTPHLQALHQQLMNFLT